ncbi:MAG: phosphonate metabolism transcriptional regulator PhnF [Nioella sp.]
MGRRALWTAIRDTLTEEIARGHYRPGDRLPPEVQLAARFGVNRHTVRRALSALAEAGTVQSRRGAGVFVAHRATDYPIGQRVRFTRNLTASGHVPDKQVLHLAARGADPREAAALHLDPGAMVQVYEGLSYSDGQPLALFRSVFPGDRFPRMLDALRETPSVTAAFRAHGLLDYTRASTRVTAKPAAPTQALHLGLQPGAPILRTVSVNVDAAGIPVEYGHTWFAGDRVTLTMGEDGPD